MVRLVASHHREACRKLGFHPPANEESLKHFSSFEKRIEHTLLKAEATERDIQTLCREAMDFGFRSVCLFPRDVALAKRLVDGSDVLVVTVLNFPFGGCPGRVVDCACKCAVEDGADEVDMVVDLPALLSGDIKTVHDGVARVVQGAGGRPVKVILETGFLSAQQIVSGSAAAEAGGAMFIKTATGFGPRGASLEDVIVMRAAVGNRMGIKASGGIRERKFAQELVDAGADLIGTSSGPHLVQGG